MRIFFSELDESFGPLSRRYKLFALALEMVDASGMPGAVAALDRLEDSYGCSGRGRSHQLCRNLRLRA